MFEKIKIQATLKTPIIMQGYLTFDALLGALLFEQCQDVEKAHAAIPLKSDQGLFYASAAILEQKIDSGDVTFVANLRAQHDLNPDLIKKNKDGTRLHRKLGLGRRQDYGAVLNNYKTTTATAVSWDIVGDFDEISDLLRNVNFIGKKRTSGFGEVISWDFLESQTDGLVSIDRQPLRPIPVEKFTGDTSLPIIDAAWKPAYWNPENRAACYAPKPIS